MAVLFDSGPRPRPGQDEELADLFARTGTPIAVSHDDDRLSRTIVERWRVGSHDLFLARGDGLVLSKPDEAAKEVLYHRIVEYAVQRLRDPATTPERIAAAHNISPRHLYRLWAHNETGIAEWIMRERLAGAARDLRDAAQRAAPIAAIARSWGFSDPAHFSRRFRHAYSMTPRSYRL